MSQTISKFLRALQGARKTRQSSVEDCYWSACEAIARGSEPRGKPAALAEAMERLGKSEESLLEDANSLAELARVEVFARQKGAATLRLKAAAVELGAAERHANEQLQEAQRAVATAHAVQARARQELENIKEAEQRAEQIRQALQRRGSPAHVLGAATQEGASGEPRAGAGVRLATQAHPSPAEPASAAMLVFAEDENAEDDSSLDGAPASARSVRTDETQSADGEVVPS